MQSTLLKRTRSEKSFDRAQEEAFSNEGAPPPATPATPATKTPRHPPRPDASRAGSRTESARVCFLLSDNVGRN